MCCAPAHLPLAHGFGLPAGTSLACTVWFHKAHNFPTMPQRLGIVYCMNRPCSLYSVKIPFICKNNTPSDLNPQAKCLTEGLLSAASPKFAPGGDRLIFLSHDAAASSGVHHATAALKCLNWSKGQFCYVLMCRRHRHCSTDIAAQMVFHSCYCSLNCLRKNKKLFLRIPFLTKMKKRIYKESFPLENLKPVVVALRALQRWQPK